MAETIRIVLVDDHPLFRDGVAYTLGAQADMTVVAQGESGDEAVRLAATCVPDVLLLDLNIPGGGIAAARAVVAAQPDVRVIMLTASVDEDDLAAAMAAGARGYILKGADKAEVLRTVTAVAEWQALFGPAIARRLNTLFQHGAQGSMAVTPFPELTEREREVLALIAQGHSNNDIATRLSISGKTVSNHVSSIFNKLQVADRAQAIVKARDANLGGR